MHGIEFPGGGCEETVDSGQEDHRKKELCSLRARGGGQLHPEQKDRGQDDVETSRKRLIRDGGFIRRRREDNYHCG